MPFSCRITINAMIFYRSANSKNYYGQTVLGHKNPTNSVHTTAANVSPLPSQLNDTCKSVAIIVHTYL